MTSTTNGEIELVLFHKSERSCNIICSLRIDDVLSWTDARRGPSIDALLVPFVAWPEDVSGETGFEVVE